MIAFNALKCTATLAGRIAHLLESLQVYVNEIITFYDENGSKSGNLGKHDTCIISVFSSILNSNTKLM